MRPALTLIDHEPADVSAGPIRLGAIRRLVAGTPWIDWPGCPHGRPLAARTQVPIGPADIGRACSVALLENDPQQPLVLGLLVRPSETPGPDIHQVGDVLVLRNGEARIELHADGTIRIRGLQIDTQAYGPHHIKGAAVKIN